MHKNPLLVWDRKMKNTETEKFINVIKDKYSVRLDSYWDFHQWTLDNLESFLAEAWDYFRVVSSKPYEKVYLKTGQGFIDNEWFSGALFNYAENLLKIRDDTTALIYIDEEGNTEMITFKELYEKVKLYTAAFRKHGLQKGDTVACYMSNRNEAVFAMLAVASVGGIWGGPYPYYGTQAALTIIKNMEAKFLISEDRYQYAGEEHDMLENLAVIAKNVLSLKKVIIVTTKKDKFIEDMSHIRNSCSIAEFLEAAKSSDGSVPDLVFEQYPANCPLFITYTSGTTGVPKGVVHSGQVLLPQLIEVAFHFNLKKGDVLMNTITMGYSDWNFFVPALALGVTVLMYAGDLCYVRSDGSNFWDTIACHKVAFTFIVTSYIDQMQKKLMVPNRSSNFEHLKLIALGGSPLKDQNYEYIFQNIKSNVFVGNYYGSSESFGLFGGFDFNLPSYAGEVQVPALGKRVECYDSEGISLTGQNGELVLTNPSPSFPLYIWKDVNHKLMNTNYLGRYKGAWWVHDECRINPTTRGIVVIGRSDEIIIQDQDIFGPDDIYRAIHDINEVQDYICVGQRKSDGDMRAVLFVKLREGNIFTAELRQKIEEVIAKNFMIGCVPQVILETKDVPYSQYGKRMETVVRKILATNHIPKVNNIRNLDSLVNFCDIPEIMIYNKL